MIQGFKPKPISFFENLIKHFQDYVVIYITELDIKHYLSSIEHLLSTKKYKTDLKASQHKRSEYEQAKLWENEYGNKVILAGGIFFKLNTSSWDLYIYNNKNFPMLHATDSLHAYAITDLKNQGVLTYDMVGVSGVTNPTDPYFGLYKYKSSFGPRFVEYLGEFDYILNAKKTLLFSRQYNFIKRLKRKYHYLINKKQEI